MVLFRIKAYVFPHFLHNLSPCFKNTALTVQKSFSTRPCSKKQEAIHLFFHRFHQTLYDIISLPNIIMDLLFPLSVLCFNPHLYL